MALGGDAVGHDLDDACERRTFMQKFDELVDRRLGALGVDKHCAVLPVADPTGQPERSRAADRRVTEPHSLHFAAHDGADRCGPDRGPRISHRGPKAVGARLRTSPAGTWTNATHRDEVVAARDLKGAQQAARGSPSLMPRSC